MKNWHRKNSVPSFQKFLEAYKSRVVGKRQIILYSTSTRWRERLNGKNNEIPLVVTMKYHWLGQWNTIVRLLWQWNTIGFCLYFKICFKTLMYLKIFWNLNIAKIEFNLKCKALRVRKWSETVFWHSLSTFQF